MDGDHLYEAVGGEPGADLHQGIRPMPMPITPRPANWRTIPRDPDYEYPTCGITLPATDTGAGAESSPPLDPAGQVAGEARVGFGQPQMQSQLPKSHSYSRLPKADLGVCDDDQGRTGSGSGRQTSMGTYDILKRVAAVKARYSHLHIAELSREMEVCCPMCNHSGILNDFITHASLRNARARAEGCNPRARERGPQGITEQCRHAAVLLALCV